MTLDEYKAQFGILIRVQDKMDENGSPVSRWRGTTTDPFDREAKVRTEDGEIEFIPRMLSLEDAGLVE